MKKYIPWLAGACLLASLFITGCHSGRHLSSSSSTAHSHNHNPQFLDSITLGGNNINVVATNTVANNNSHKKSRHRKHHKEDPVIEKYAGIMGIGPEAITNHNLYQFIDEWYGVEYKLGGNDKNGIDCSAFVQRLYQEVFGTDIVRTVFEQFSKCCLRSDTDSLKEGDLVFFHINGSRISHVGVYLANHFFVHASVSQGIMVSSLNEGYWQRSYAGAGEMLALAPALKEEQE